MALGINNTKAKLDGIMLVRFDPNLFTGYAHGRASYQRIIKRSGVVLANCHGPAQPHSQMIIEGYKGVSRVIWGTKGLKYPKFYELVSA